MLVKINSKPIQVRDDSDKPDWTYTIFKSLAILCAMIPINAVTKAFLGVSFFSGFINDFMGLFSWFF